MIQNFRKSLIVACWFVFLTAPLILISVDYIEGTIQWRWSNLIWMGLATFILSMVWRYFLEIKESLGSLKMNSNGKKTFDFAVLVTLKFRNPVIARILFSCLWVLPLFLPTYHTSIFVTTMMYIILGLGLNIVVGMAGLLDLGYVAFYAVGAYLFALLHMHFQIGFWTALPLAGLTAALLGILLGIPVLRLRGDYLAIVTLGFGEIIRLVLENWGDVTGGPGGIPDLPQPGLFGIDFDFQSSMIYFYYIVLVFMIFAIIVTQRLQKSRIGRAWTALREDEIACEAMGVDTTKTKLTAFALGAFWAGLVGVFVAAKGSFINPASFTFHESAIILSIVVLGGMGSILGVIIAAFLLILLPEYLRFLSEYRMLLFGATMVVMMVFRPQGLIHRVKRSYKLRDK